MAFSVASNVHRSSPEAKFPFEAQIVSHQWSIRKSEAEKSGNEVEAVIPILEGREINRVIQELKWDIESGTLLKRRQRKKNVYCRKMNSFRDPHSAFSCHITHVP